MDYSAIIDRLEADIRRFRVEYQRFFNGDAPIPPQENADRIRKQLRTLILKPDLSAVDQFRLSALESRYNSFTELFRRRQRDADAVRHDPTEAARRPPRVDLGNKSRMGDVSELYEALYARGSSKVTLDVFHTYLVDRAAEVRQRTGCEKVRFSVRNEGGKQKLKARPV